ncbi:ABC transporter permease [bacterium]|nr:ABC transporter permease [bacterium]
MKAIFYLVQKEFRQIFRDHMMVRIIFLLPLLQLFIFGYAVNNDLKDVRISILDQDNSVESRHLADAFLNSSLFIPGPAAHSPADLDDLIYKGKTDITLWIPNDYSSSLSVGQEAQVGIAVDGKNSNLGGRAGGYAMAIIRQEGQRLRDARMLDNPLLRAKMKEIKTATRFFYNPELVSRTYMVPGIVVLVVTIISGLLTGMAVVRENEIGTLEQLMVTPITSLQLIAGKTIPFMILAFFELAFATVVAVLWFKIPIAGSLWLLTGSSLVYLVVTLGSGILASTVSRTQQQAMFTVWFFLVFGILMSGFFYPIENMPMAMQWLTYLNPLRYFLSIVRGLFLKGITLSDSLPDLIPMALLGIIIFGAAILRFRKTVA